jgi:hypothetical protein
MEGRHPPLGTAVTTDPRAYAEGDEGCHGKWVRLTLQRYGGYHCII